MKNKKVLILGITLILLAIVAGVVMAGELKGVSYANSVGHLYLTNHNDYTVTVLVKNDDNGTERGILLQGGASKDVEGNYTVLDVTKGRY